MLYNVSKDVMNVSPALIIIYTIENFILVLGYKLVKYENQLRELSIPESNSKSLVDPQRQLTGYVTGQLV